MSQHVRPGLERIRVASRPLAERGIDHAVGGSRVPVLVRADLNAGRGVGSCWRAVEGLADHPRGVGRLVAVRQEQRFRGDVRIGLALADVRKTELPSARLGPRPECGPDAPIAVRGKDVGLGAPSVDLGPCHRRVAVEDEERVDGRIEAHPRETGHEVIAIDIGHPVRIELARDDELGDHIDVVEGEPAGGEPVRQLDHSVLHPGHRSGATGPGRSIICSSAPRTSSNVDQGTNGTPSERAMSTSSSLANTTSAYSAP